MKKITLSIAAIIAATTLVAQTREGTITYERKVNMHRRITDEQIKAMIPEFRTSKHQLLFSDSTSIYKAVVEDETPDPFASGNGPTVMIRTAGDGGEQYRDYSKGKAVDARELGAKSYIIEDSIKQYGWKLTDETKTILNYTCRKATFKSDRGQAVEAWFTESIPCPAGPEGFSGLPGVILAVDVNNGEMTYTATNVSDKVDKAGLKEPKKGKKVTRQEFAKITEEMFGKPGEGGRVVRIGN